MVALPFLFGFVVLGILWEYSLLRGHSAIGGPLLCLIAVALGFGSLLVCVLHQFLSVKSVTHKKGFLMILAWVLFNLFVLAMLALDLGVLRRKTHNVSTKEALIWTAVWISLAMVFCAVLYLFGGPEPALQFLTGYLIEKLLSVDNLAIFMLLFTAFQVPAAYQHRVLSWGIVGALIMRGTLIVGGTALIGTFHWVFFLFGVWMIIAGIRMALEKEEEEEKVNPEQKWIFRQARRFLPLTEGYEGERFVVRRAGRLLVTPLVLVLLVVETTDLVFALDSIPAIFVITQAAFIVYTSNVFAILGLRSLYFVFSNIAGKFYYLKRGLAVILALIGLEMFSSAAHFIEVPTGITLGLISAVLAAVVVASSVRERRLAKVEIHQEEGIIPEGERPV